jgi:hypothetical protein
VHEHEHEHEHELNEGAQSHCGVNILSAGDVGGKGRVQAAIEPPLAASWRTCGANNLRVIGGILHRLHGGA